MPDQHQLDLLTTHEAKLADLLVQQARLGIYTPHYILQEIRDSTEAIETIKNALRAREHAGAPHTTPAPAAQPAAEAATPGSVHVGGDVHDSILITGNNNRVTRTR